MYVSDGGDVMAFDLKPTDQPRTETTKLAREHARCAQMPVLGGRTKRVLDFTIALVALILLSPLLVLLSLSIRNLSRGPSLYGHKRIGAGGREFRCLKFRTMVSDGDQLLARYLADNPAERRQWEENRKLKDDPRVTWLGRILRAYSVDELPQLVNVLRGEMSLVGPRPVVREELARYGDAATLYTSARPGITGLWQVSGRSDTSYAQRIRLDCDYVLNWTLMRDIAILFRTIPSVLFARGSY